MNDLHPDFVLLEDICHGLIVELKYAAKDNFTGSVVPGYKANKAYLASLAAEALARVSTAAASQDLALKIFDSYRPAKAVQFFHEWAKRTEDNDILKKRFYPGFGRLELFEKGFIARHSSHSRGAAVDLTLVYRSTGLELDMGTEFDYFHEKSHTEASGINLDQMRNRKLLKDLMEQQGFSNFYQEWWHYSFQPEPFPDSEFDFDVK